MVCIDDFALKKRHRYGTVMIDIETGKIIDLIESRDLEDVEKWLKEFENIILVSRDGSVTYKTAITNAHPDAIQVSDRFHILKNLTEYGKRFLKKVFDKQVSLKEEIEIESPILKKYEYETKWELILAVQELRSKNCRITEVSEILGISEKTVMEYNKIGSSVNNLMQMIL